MIKYSLILIIVFMFGLLYASAETICEFDFLFHKNNTVELVKINSFVEDKEVNAPIQSDYKILFIDDKANIIDSINLPAVFYMFDKAQGKEEVNLIPLSVRKTCNPKWRRIQISHNEQKIFSYNIKELICNNDKICNYYESYLTCPVDCPSGSKDGWCDRKLDSICDPDCIIPTRDPDCKDIKLTSIKNSTPKNINYLYIIIAGILIILIFYLIKKKRSTTKKS